MDNQCLHPAAHENPCHGPIWFLLRISNPRGVVQWLYNPMFLSTSILIESYRLMFIWRFVPFISWIARCLCILSISKTSPWGHAQGPLTLRPGEWSCCSMAAAEQQVGTAAKRADAILALNEGQYPKNCMMFDLGIVLHTPRFRARNWRWFATRYGSICRTVPSSCGQTSTSWPKSGTTALVEQ